MGAVAFTVTKRVDAIRITLPAGDLTDGDGKPLRGVPLRHGGAWSILVDLATGQIHGWPAGRALRVCAKVCDAGFYHLLSEGFEVARLHGYVPNGVVPGDCGDYVDLHIDAAGRITNWPAEIDLSEFDDSEED